MTLTDSEPVRVLVVDDHELFRHGVMGILRRHPQVEVVGEAADGLEALEKARELMPDVILMDINMPRLGGIEATQRLKQEFPYVRIVVLTVSDLDESLFSALKAGASGYLLKNVGAQQLVDGVVGAARGEAPLSGAIAARILQELRTDGGEPDDGPYRSQEPGGGSPAGSQPRAPGSTPLRAGEPAPVGSGGTRTEARSLHRPPAGEACAPSRPSTAAKICPCSPRGSRKSCYW